MDDDNAFLNVPEDYENDEQCLRRSQDSGTVNARGRNLLETCTALNLRILNGRIVGDLEGKKTCFHYNGSSVVDYVIGSKKYSKEGAMSYCQDGLKSQQVQSRLEAAVNHDSIDIASELISETLVEACKEAGLKARSSKMKCKSQNKWFDEEC